VPRRRPGKHIGVNPLGVEEVQTARPEASPRQRQHSGAGIHTSDASLRERSSAFEKKAAVTFPHDENVLAMGDLAQKGRSAALQLAPGQYELFHR